MKKGQEKSKKIDIGFRDIIRETSEVSGFTSKDCKTIVEAYIKVLREHITAGETVPMKSIGVFYSTDINHCQAIHPITKEMHDVYGWHRPMFKYSRDFRDLYHSVIETHVAYDDKECGDDEDAEGIIDF